MYFRFCSAWIPGLWSTSLDAGDQDTRLQNTAPPGVSVDVAHYEQSLEALKEGDAVHLIITRTRQSYWSISYCTCTVNKHLKAMCWRCPFWKLLNKLPSYCVVEHRRWVGTPQTLAPCWERGMKRDLPAKGPSDIIINTSVGLNISSFTTINGPFCWF